MSDLILIVYLVDVLSNIKTALGLFLSLTPLVVLSSFLFNEMFEYPRHLVIKVSKILLVLFLIALPIQFLIPSERNMYVMAGLYAGDKVITSISQSEVTKQAEKTLIAKLKDLEREYSEKSAKNE